MTLTWKNVDIATAAKDQLGLQVIRGKRNLEVLVVDHVEKWPTP
jgi:uncharacterized protein (TIGR03435 family)